MNKTEYIRQFISFSGKCPYACNHCYTFSNGYNTYDSGASVKEIINYLKSKRFDIVYISGHKENFVDAGQGIELCEELFYNFHTDLMITTRSVFTKEQLSRLEKLNILMKAEQKMLFFCASIPALESYYKLESNPQIPLPYLRIENLKSVYERGILTFLTLRPLCPDSYIPIEEIINIINLCKNHTSIVLSSGIVINAEILNKLNGFPEIFESQDKPLMPCLKNDLSMKYVNVEKELAFIKRKCLELKLPFFEHSLPAIHFLKNTKDGSERMKISE